MTPVFIFVLLVLDEQQRSKGCTLHLCSLKGHALAGGTAIALTRAR